MSPLPGGMDNTVGSHMARECSRSGEACCELLYSVYLTFTLNT